MAKNNRDQENPQWLIALADPTRAAAFELGHATRRFWSVWHKAKSLSYYPDRRLCEGIDRPFSVLFDDADPTARLQLGDVIRKLEDTFRRGFRHDSERKKSWPPADHCWRSLCYAADQSLKDVGSLKHWYELGVQFGQIVVGIEVDLGVQFGGQLEVDIERSEEWAMGQRVFQVPGLGHERCVPDVPRLNNLIQSAKAIPAQERSVVPELASLLRLYSENADVPPEQLVYQALSQRTANEDYCRHARIITPIIECLPHLAKLPVSLAAQRQSERNLYHQLRTMIKVIEDRLGRIVPLPPKEAAETGDGRATIDAGVDRLRHDGSDKQAPKSLRPCEKQAYNSYLEACANCPGVSQRKLHAWLREHGSGDDKLPNLEAWARYVRTATRYYEYYPGERPCTGHKSVQNVEKRKPGSK